MKILTPKQKAYRLSLAARRGESPRAYMARVGWNYHTVRAELVRSGEWQRVMAAKYAQSEETQ